MPDSRRIGSRGREKRIARIIALALAGLLAFNPRLFVSTPQGGEAAEYLPVTAASLSSPASRSMKLLLTPLATATRS